MTVGKELREEKRDCCIKEKRNKEQKKSVSKTEWEKRSKTACLIRRGQESEQGAKIYTYNSSEVELSGVEQTILGRGRQAKADREKQREREAKIGTAPKEQRARH